MQQAMALAERARGKCSPNPFVGAILVKDDRIIGIGCTQAYGSDHAEVQAIKNATEDVTGAELYVTLEPCAHYGKTPPCAQAIIDHKIGKVFAGIADPNPLVNGKGFQMLRAAGITVQHGYLEQEITRQLEYYLCYITRQRPFVTLKTAMSLDGRIATADGSSRWITGDKSREKVHQLRQENDVVMTGIGTVLADDPTLNVRVANPFKQPVRAILDTELQIPLDSKIVQTAGGQRTLIFTTHASLQKPQADTLINRGLELFPVSLEAGILSLTEILHQLYQLRFSAVMLEAGTTLNSTFWKQQAVDKLVCFMAPTILGGNKTAWYDIGIDHLANRIDLTETSQVALGDDYCLTGYPRYHTFR